MGSLWSRCCDSDEEDADSDVRTSSVNQHESLLLARRASASESGDWSGDASPEEERSRRRRAGGTPPKSSATQVVPMPRLFPASAEEEREYMVRSYSSGALFDIQPECMLCMETFTEAHPKAVAVCACGVNRNNFHLDCLMEWRRNANKTNCPGCEHELFFDTSTVPTMTSPTEMMLTAAAVTLSNESPRLVVQ